MNNETVTLNVEGLDKILKALKQKPPVARIGILGGKNSRTKTKAIPTNSEVGAAHEFGAPSRGLPQRSFLRVPIADHLQKELEKQGALSENEFKEVIKQGSVVPWLTKIAIMAENIVRGAFDSAGYGKWAAWKTPGYKNNTGMILVDSTQLRDAITSDVTE